MMPLFITIVRMGIGARTAVSKSIPIIPNAASPMMLTASQSGLASAAPRVRPKPVPSWVDLPQPR